MSSLQQCWNYNQQSKLAYIRSRATDRRKIQGTVSSEAGRAERNVRIMSWSVLQSCSFSQALTVPGQWASFEKTVQNTGCEGTVIVGRHEWAGTDWHARVGQARLGQSQIGRHGLAVTARQAWIGRHGLGSHGQAGTDCQARVGQSWVCRHGLAGTSRTVMGRHSQIVRHGQAGTDWQARVGQSWVGRHGLACIIAFLILLKLHLPCRLIGVYFMFFSFVIPYPACMDQISIKTPNLSVVLLVFNRVYCRLEIKSVMLVFSIPFFCYSISCMHGPNIQKDTKPKCRFTGV